MKSFKLTPIDATGEYILRQSIATGKQGDNEFTADMCLSSGDIIVNYRGKQVSLSFKDMVKKTLDAIDEEME